MPCRPNLADLRGHHTDNLHPVQRLGGFNPAGTWSPDGTRIVCNGDNYVQVVDVVTGEVSFVAEGKGAQWLDDHTLLVEAWGQ